MLVSVTTVLGYALPIPARAVQSRFVHRVGTLLCIGFLYVADMLIMVLYVADMLIMVVSARSTIHPRLIASGDGSGVRAAPRIRMRGGHG